MTLLTLLFFAAFSHTSAAATPEDALLGDWDLGPTMSALRISLKDSESLFVQFCKRDQLLTAHVCSASMILYFNFSPESQYFVHDDAGGQHLHATLALDAQDPSVIHYSFKTDLGAGEFVGKKL